MKTFRHLFVVFICCVVARGLHAELSVSQIQFQLTVAESAFSMSDRRVSELRQNIAELNRELSGGRGVALGSKDASSRSDQDPSRPMKESRLRQMQAYLENAERTNEKNSADVSRLQRELAAAEARSRAPAAPKPGRSDPTADDPHGGPVCPLHGRYYSSQCPRCAADERPNPGYNPSPRINPGTTLTPVVAPPATKAAPWKFPSTPPPAKLPPAPLLSSTLGSPAPSQAPVNLLGAGQPGEPNLGKGPFGNLDNPQRGLRKTERVNTVTGAVQKLYVDSDGTAYDTDGSPFDPNDLGSMQARDEGHEAYLRNNDLTRGAENDEKRFYLDMVKDWQKRFEEGKATWDDHPTRIKVPDGLPRVAGMLSLEGGAAARYFAAVIKPRAERTARDIQSPDLLAQGIVRTNFKANMEDYVNIVAKSQKAMQILDFEELGIKTTDKQVANAIDQTRITAGELAMRNNLVPPIGDVAAGIALEASRVRDWAELKKGFYTKDTTYAEKYVKGTIPENPLQIQPPLKTQPGVQTDTPAPAAPPANYIPADATSSKGSPKSG